MAFEPPYFGFVEFFAPREHREIEALLDELDKVSGLEDIYLLARANAFTVAGVIKGEVTLKDFWSGIGAEATTIASLGAPANPSAPTLGEKRVINGMLEKFYALWPGRKRAVLEAVIRYVGEDVENTEDPYRILASISTASGSGLEDDFYMLLAEYYIGMAAEYIRTAGREYVFIGKVVDAPTTGGGVKVTCVDENAGEQPISYGWTTTNKAGYYQFRFRVLEGITSSSYELKMTFSHPLLTGSDEFILAYVVADPKTPVETALTFTRAASSSSTISATGVSVPAAVTAYLTANDLTATRLEHIRQLGGFRNLPSDDIDPTSAALVQLDGLAALELLQPDLAKNQTLFSRAYKNIADIALAPRGKFIEDNTDLFGDLGAGRIHYQAKALHLYGINNAAASLAPIPDHTIGKARTTPTTAKSCNCPDCRSAVSPIAYLADLLGFTYAHVLKSGSNKLDIPFLEDRFHHRMGGLQLDCEQLKKPVCQNRIAAENLRHFQREEGGNEPTGDQLTALEAAERAYLEQAYELLLGKLGTSYNEVRNARGLVSSDVVEKIAHKLGIPLLHEGTTTTISKLFIDLSDPENITEGETAGAITGLESLFGLRDTRRDPLSDPEPSLVEQWKMARLREIWEEQDGLGPAFPGEEGSWNAIIDPDVVTIDDLRYPEAGLLGGFSVPFDLWKKRRDWIDAEFAAMDESFVLDVDDSPVNRRRTVFKDLRLVVAYGLETTLALSNEAFDFIPAGELPIEYTMVDQFQANGNTYIRIAEVPDQDYYGGTLDFVGEDPHTNEPVNIRSCASMVARLEEDETTPYGAAVIPTFWSSGQISIIRSILAEQGPTESAALATLALDGASARRLLELYDKNQATPLAREPEGGLTDAEWVEFKNILLLVLKRRACDDVWRTEETGAQLKLGPKHFMPAVNGPREGDFPLLGDGPFLDPDLVGTRDLPEITAATEHLIDGDSVYQIVADRRAELVADREALVGAVDTAALLAVAFDSPDLDWTPGDASTNEYLTLLNSLAEPAEADWARFYIEQRLKVSEAELSAIVTYGVRADEGEQIPAGELENVLALLQRAHKHIVRYKGDWLTKEATADQWELRKGSLPKWRATQEQRSAWLNALARNSEAPIIDADLIGPADLRSPQEGDRAYGLWEARATERDNWLALLSSGNGQLTNLTQFNALLKSELGFAEPTIESLRDSSIGGVDIRPRLAQLNLTAVEFNQVMVYHDLLAGTPVTALRAEEKVVVRHILVRVKKRREATQYRIDECATAEQPIITLSQDHFKTRSEGVLSYPPDPAYPVQPWLADEGDLAAWRRKLASRVEQEKEVKEAWQEALFEVDEAMMVHLRDALVTASGDPKYSLIENASDLGDRFLIDLENNCCYKTNRVAAAIETLQQLIWKTRTGDIRQHYPDFTFNGDFDQAWEWMGSYANWRAAMFVFLYPENVLHPSLRSFSSQAFKDVVQATRNNRRFGPDDACKTAHAYEEYLKDLNELEVACAQQARSWHGNDECGKPKFAPRTLTYVFAKAKGSKRPYFAVLDTNDQDNVKQVECWSAIPVPDGVDYILHGTHRYINDDLSIDHILLFVTDSRDSDTSKFYLLRYGLKSRQWDDEPRDFSIGTDDLLDEGGQVEEFDAFDPRIRSFCVMKNLAVWQSPTLVITLNDADGRPWSFKRDLNAALDGLGGDGIWSKWVTMSSVDPNLGSLMGSVIDCWNYNPPAWSFDTAVQFFLLRSPGDTAGTYYLSITRFQNISGGVKYRKFFGPGGSDPRSRLMVNWDASGSQSALLGFGYSPEFRPINYTDGVFTAPGVFTYYYGSSALCTETTIFIAVNANDGFEGDFQVSLLQESGFGTTPPSVKMVTTVLAGDDPETLNWDAPLLELLPSRTRELGIGKAGAPPEQAIKRTFNRVLWEANEGANDKHVVPVAEATYFVPMQIALQLHANGHYQAALDWFRSVYDYTLPSGVRKISYLLRQEEELELNANRMANWYGDPLNPHAIASVRPHTYTRYTIRAIVSCLLDYADAEFTMDNSESVPRARELYEDALDLLKYLSGGHDCAITDALALIKEHAVPKAWVLVYTETLERLDPIAGKAGYQDLLEDISDAMEAAGSWGDRLAAVNALIDAGLTASPTPTLETALEVVQDTLSISSTAGSAGANVDLAYTALSRTVSAAFDHTMELVTGRTTSFLSTQELDFLRLDTAPLPFETEYDREYLTPTLLETTRTQSIDAPSDSFYLNDPFSAIYLSGTALAFCVVPNPVVYALVLKAEVELFKIRNCRNIAGMVRELDPFAAPTDTMTGIQVIGAAGGSINIPSQRPGLPSPYRYRFLVERARQLVAMAQQVEAAFLGALEKLDAERYAELRAEQDVATSKANIKLQNLRVREAEDGVELAELQKERARLQINGLQSMVDQGLLQIELDLFGYNYLLATLQSAAQVAETLYRSSQLASAAAGSSIAGLSLATAAAIPGFAALVTQQAAQLGVYGLTAVVQNASIRASFERRKQEWEFQLTLARKDEQIGDQQIKLANDRVRIVGQEREIAVLQNDHAKATLDFLRNKFTNAELYEWMSGVLEDVYAWFLQEATAVALMAERQLIFERNIDFPPFIRSDYWQMDPNQLGTDLGGGGSTDRRGLTGSTRLLRDLTQLDQAAFSTNSPKRQLSKTFSLSELAPEQLIRLRAQGIASFYTTHDHFDRDYPGHYLRLIKKVSVTVIALVPPTRGIRATLSNGGTSRVFTGGVFFQEQTIKRYPDEIALSSGVGDSGVFAMLPEGEFLNPFEGSGVETLWEFRMDKAANPFDYASLADVLFNIEYEALSDGNRRTALANQLNQEAAEGALAISFKNNLPDQWFDLHNTLQSATPYRVTFNLNQRDLAPHVKQAKVSGLSLYVVMKDDEAEFNGEMEVGLGNMDGFTVQPQQNLVTSGQFGSSTIVGRPVVELWSFAVSEDSTPARAHFDNDEVEDIYLVIRYTGDGAKYTLP